jgi:hypothetical protein
MTTTKSELVIFTKQSNELINVFIKKREKDFKIKLNILDRTKLLDLKDTIDKFLKDCKDDGY